MSPNEGRMSTLDTISTAGYHLRRGFTHPDKEMADWHKQVGKYIIESHPAYGQFNKMKNTATQIVGSSSKHAQNLMNHALKGNFLGGLKTIADERKMRGVFDKSVSGMKSGFENHVNNLAQVTATAKLPGFSLFKRKPKNGSSSYSNPMFGRGGKRKTAKRKTSKRKTKKNRRH